MKAEIIAVGTELLLGQIVNSNAQFLSIELAALGIDVYFQTVVGDNKNRLLEAIEIARNRADIILFTGGIGPTEDDLTKDALAAALGRTLHIDQLAMDHVQRFFDDRKIVMTENNRKQALVIEGTTPLSNEIGLAVGIAFAEDNKYYIVLPGPPREMKPMFTDKAKPWLQQHALTSEMPIYSKMLKFAGIGESLLEDKLIDLIRGQSDPTIAPYAKEGEVTVRISTKAPSEREAMVKLDVLEKKIADILPENLYANIDVPLEQLIVDWMADAGLTLSAAESCTGGLLMESITNIPGSASMFAGGIVCYSNDLKKKLLNVPAAMLEGPDAPGAVSREVAEVLAEQVRMIGDSDFGLSVTGVAGPGYSERKPVGLVFVGLAERGRKTEVYELNLKGTRENIRLRTVKALLYRLWRRLEERKVATPLEGSALQ
ncbi:MULTISPECIES: competence/damage-inducible protein A [Paenibacillus]|jgi:nicotinamide-nucleotide amidase|uniref:competence/damage-inducible protein A n=1 Tax=Paenibacillus TaxID=44249 RepID=UPI0004F6DE90|nr:MULTISPECIES: competence/damage-inducible protein A [unclassified Paenibacillus]AIQ30443.1 damage-inducible protein CinA [Paenibacillus sp. FSL P4-0081]OMF23587.1 competence/damage-inducible protein A [Paenibacillus sp. FSL H8-0259]